MTEFCRLNLVFGPAQEEHVCAALIEHEPALPGFTLLKAEGHSNDFGHATLRERVRGRIERRVLWMVLPRESVPAVLDEVRARVGKSAVLWWIEPVEQMGRLA